MKLRIITFLLLWFCFATCFCVPEKKSLAQENQVPDKVRAIKTIKGKLIGFQIGDYTHAVIRKQNRKTQSFFIWEPGLGYFLALHKGQPSEFTYEIVDTYIPQEGSVMRIERLTSAKVGTLTYEAWWKKIDAKYSVEELDKKYGGLIEKYRVR